MCLINFEKVERFNGTLDIGAISQADKRARRCRILSDNLGE